jgi:hypothetical protein
MDVARDAVTCGCARDETRPAATMIKKEEGTAMNA